MVDRCVPDTGRRFRLSERDDFCARAARVTRTARAVTGCVLETGASQARPTIGSAKYGGCADAFGIVFSMSANLHERRLARPAGMQ